MKNILLITIVSLLSSCNEFLKPYSETEYIPENIESIAELLVGNVYINPVSDKTLFGFNEFSSDNISTLSDKNFILNEFEKTNALINKKIYGFDPNMFNPNVGNIGIISQRTWREHYVRIKSCNAILDYIEKVSCNNNDLKNRVYAEAYFFRAFYYFNLVNLFSTPYTENRDALGVPVKLTSDFNPNLMSRNSVKEVYDQIISDLSSAESYYSKFAEGKYFYAVEKPSVYSLYLFRSRVELYMGNWQKAVDYSKKVIDSKFELFDLNTVKIPTILTNDEFPYPSYTSINNPNSETIFVYGNPHSHLLQYTFGTIPKKTGINKSNSDLNISYFVVSQTLLGSFASGDLRKDLYVTLEFTKNPGMVGPIEGYYKPLGKIELEYHTVKSGTFAYSFRVSEAYLNCIESLARLNKNSEAKLMLQTLLKNRYNKPNISEIISSISEADLLQFVLSERRKELCFEGHRWFDQRRLGMKSFEKLWYEDKGVLVNRIKVSEKDPAFTLPIPQVVLDNNTKLIQNPTWGIKY